MNKKWLLVLGLLLILPIVSAAKSPMLYYTFDSNSDDSGDASLHYNLAPTAAPLYVNAKVDKGINLSSNNAEYALNTSALGSELTKIRTVDMWINNSHDNDNCPLTIYEDADNYFYICIVNQYLRTKLKIGGTDMFEFFSTGYSMQEQKNNWTRVVVVTGSGGAKIYYNGNTTPYKTHASTNVTGEWTNIVVGANYANADKYKGVIDNIALFDEEYTTADITYGWNSGAGRNFMEGGIPSIDNSTYNCTSAYQNYTMWRTNYTFPIPTEDSTPTVTFNTNVNSNCSIGLSDLNYTNMTGADANTSCSTNQTTSMTCTLPTSKKLASGGQNIYISCINTLFGNETATSTSGALRINFNPISPEINLSSVNCTSCYSDQDEWSRNTTYLVPNINSTPIVNFTISESGNCSIGDVNQNYSTMVAGDANTSCSTTETTGMRCHLPTSQSLGEGSQDIYLSCIDLLGNENTSSTLGPLRIATPIINYSNIRVTETSEQQFNITFWYNTTAYTPAVFLHYNGTQYLASLIKESTTNSTYARDLIIPLTTSGNVQNRTFFWNITTFSLKTDDTNQSSYRINVNNCTTASSNITLNFSSYDEESEALLNVTLETSWFFWDKTGDGSLYRSDSNEMGPRNNFTFCINPAWINLTTEATVEYSATGYGTRQYYLSNYNLDNVSELINLYLLNTSSMTTFQLRVRDTKYYYYSGVIIKTEKYSRSNDTYLVVESCETDHTGRCLTHLILEDELYRFTVEQDGVAIYTTSNSQAYCPLADLYEQCLLEIVIRSAIDQEHYSWENISGMAYGLSFVNATNTSTLTYSTPVGSIENIRFKVSRGDVTICNGSSTAAAGTISCDVTGYDDVKQQVYATVDDDEILLYTTYLDVVQDWGVYGLTGVFFLILLLLTVGAAALATRSVVASIVLVLTVLGVFSLLNIGGLPTTAYILLAVVGALIIIKVKT